MSIKSELETLFALQLTQAGEATFQRECKEPYWGQGKKRSPSRGDFCFSSERIVIELMGGTWSNGAHTRGVQYAKDCEKLNSANIDGWLTLWFTTDHVMTSEYALKTTLEALRRRRDGIKEACQETSL